jgi:hypothetical protein
MADLLREIVAYAREAGHDWLSLHEADKLLGDDTTSEGGGS